MKNPIAIAAFASLLTITFASAQAQRTRGSAPIPVPTRNVPAPHKGAPDELEKNISISLSGKMANGLPLDLTMTGCGRLFQSEAILGSTEVAGSKIPNIGSIEFLVRPLGTGYMISYSIGVRMAIPTSSTVPKGGAATTTSVGFEEVQVSGTVRCKPDEALEIFKSGDQAMTLKVVEN